MKQQLILTCLTASLIALPLPAADRVPKEMKPKLIQEGKVLIDEKFDDGELDKRWIIPTGDFASAVTIEQGHAVIVSGPGCPVATLRQMLDKPEPDASMQLLVRPPAAGPAVVIAFISSNESGVDHWQTFTYIFDTDNGGLVNVTIIKGMKDGEMLKSARIKVKKKKEDWWRVSVESKGDRYIVRVNGDDLIDMELPDKAKGMKRGVMMMIYGSKCAVDEIKVTAAKP